jgi:hypothetical protein
MAITPIGSLSLSIGTVTIARTPAIAHIAGRGAWPLAPFSAGFPNVRVWSAYHPILTVIADIATQPDSANQRHLPTQLVDDAIELD